MTDNMTPTKEQMKEFTVKALGIAGFTEKENYQWLYTQEHGMKTVVVDLNKWPVKPYFNVDGKMITEDDEHATLKKVRTIIKEAEDGQMPSRTEADIVVNVGTKDTYADEVDDKSRAPVRMRESRMTSAQLSLRKGEHDDGD